MKSILSFFKSNEEQLLEGTKHNDVDIIKKILAKEVNVNYTDSEYGRTALHWAVFQGYHDIVNLLAPFHKSFAIDKTGKIPLHLAVIKNDLVSINILSQYDPCFIRSIISRDNEGKTPVYFAVEQQLSEILILFIDQSLASFDKNELNETSEFSEIFPAIADFIELIESNQKKLDKELNSSLIKNISNLRSLIKEPISLPKKSPQPPIFPYTTEKTDKLPRAPLSITTEVTKNMLEAVRRGDTIRVRDYLEQGADMNVADHLGKTPLHIAAENDDTGITRLLLARGAELTAKDLKGNTALVLAKAHTLPILKEALQKTKTDLTATSEKQTNLATTNQQTYLSKDVLFTSPATKSSIEHLDLATLDQMIIKLENQLKILKELKSAKEKSQPMASYSMYKKR